MNRMIALLREIHDIAFVFFLFFVLFVWLVLVLLSYHQGGRYAFVCFAFFPPPPFPFLNFLGPIREVLFVR